MTICSTNGKKNKMIEIINKLSELWILIPWAVMYYTIWKLEKELK